VVRTCFWRLYRTTSGKILSMWVPGLGCATVYIPVRNRPTSPELPLQAGQATIDKIELAKYSISEPFEVGVDNGGSVARKEYTSPFKFSDKLNSVRFDLAPGKEQAPVDLEVLTD